MLSRLAVLLILAASAWAEDQPAPVPAQSAGPEPTAPLEFTLEGNDGKPYPLSQHKGQVVLIVNTASKCGFTPQYEGLEALYRKYKDQGFAVIAIPSNDFSGQEPGSNQEIRKFCTTKYKVTFPLMGKVHAKGPDICPFYKFMIKQGPKAAPIAWNFNKFLIGRDGQIIDRYASDIEPANEDLVKAIEAALGMKSPPSATTVTAPPASAPAAASPQPAPTTPPAAAPAPAPAPVSPPAGEPSEKQSPGRITVD